METGVGVLDKVMSILYLFNGKQQFLTVQEIVDRLNYSVPTVYRLIGAMAKHGLVKREGEMISLGSTLMTLGSHMLANLDICTEARQPMEELNQRTNENVHLNIRNRNQRVVIQAFQSTLNVRSTVTIGDTYPIFSGAAGKVFLSYYTKEECRDVLSETDEYAAVNEVNQRIYDRFIGVTDQIREIGYAISVNERKQGIVAVAAPVFDYTGKLSAVLTLVAPESRMDEARRYEMGPLVRDQAALISANMGYAGKTTH